MTQAGMAQTSAGEPVLEIADLSKTYGGRAGGVKAVQNVSLTVPAGEVYGFLGANGAGKSTTIRMLLGLITPSSGTIKLFGQDLRHGQPPRKVGSLVDGGAFYPFLSGRRNLDVLSRTQGLDGANIDALLAQVGLADAGKRKVKGYSTGMRQRLGVAAALLNDPDLVILDEPANGLDAAGIIEMRTLIRSLAEERGKTVFLSSHLLNEVQQTCDRVAIIERGTMIREAPINELLNEESGIRVTATPIAAAQAALGDWTCTVIGDAINIAAGPGDAPEITRRLIAAGVDIFSLAPHQRSLEEAFLAITQAETANA